MKQGEVWALPGSYMKGVVISSDDFNEQPGFRAIVIPLVRSRDEAEGLSVQTIEADNTSGVILPQFPQHIRQLDGKPEATLSGQTMAHVVDAVQQLFSY